MKKILLILFTITLIFIAGCIPRVQDNQGNQNLCDRNVCVPMYKLENNACTFVECGSGCGPDNIETFSTLQECQSKIVGQETPAQTLSLKEFTIEGDDYGLYPDTITVNQGDRVKITFKVRENKVYYGGLDFRSSVWGDTGKVLPGASTVVEFIAQNTFTYRSYWPSSNRLKATGTINVV